MPPIKYKTRAKRRRVVGQRSRRRRRQQQHRGGLNVENQLMAAALDANLTNTTDRMQKVLKVVCKSANKCQAIGQYNDIIMKYFDNFENLQLIQPGTIVELSRGANGIVLFVQFKKGQYMAATTLKKSLQRLADNLYYEWYIGRYFINDLVNVFPVFLQTYGVYSMPPIARSADSAAMIRTLTPYNPRRITDSCMEHPDIVFFSQYYSNIMTYKNYYDNTGSLLAKQVNILGVLYQIYYPLSVLSENYTHNDLHWSNVMMYKPFEGRQYVQMNYHYENHLGENDVISFPTEYIVKIIDYGRNFFEIPEPKQGIEKNSETFIQKICDDTITCGQNCGETKGYHQPTMNAALNRSADLRFASIIKSKGLLNGFDIVFTGKYGTPENLQSNMDSSGNFMKNANGEYIINNVPQLLEALTYLIPQSMDPINAYFRDWKCMGILHVYDTGQPYTFEYVTPTTSARAATTSAASAPIAIPIPAAKSSPSNFADSHSSLFQPLSMNADSQSIHINPLSNSQSNSRTNTADSHVSTPNMDINIGSQNNSLGTFDAHDGAFGVFDSNFEVNW